MLSMILALLAAGGPDAMPPPRVVSPLTVTAQPLKAPPADITVNIDSDDDAIGSQHVSVWPTGAWESRTNGKVTLTCFVDVHGLAERCHVAFESPQGRGFGAAAMQLQPTLRLTPARGADGAPVGAMMNIALAFNAPVPDDNLHDMMQATNPMSGRGIDSGNLQVHHNPIEMRRVVMMNNPVWVKAPSFDDLAKAYPQRAGGVEGYTVAHCEVSRSTGEVRNCVIAKEDPVGHDFAHAAKILAAQFRVSPQAMKYAPHGAPVEVDIPIRFTAPTALNRTVEAPTWLAGVDPETLPRLFPPEAAAKGVTTGRGVARCVVAMDGTMTDCAPEAADPAGLGFSESAVKLASTMKMNLWSADAAPVEGGVVHVAFRLNLDGAK